MFEIKRKISYRKAGPVTARADILFFSFQRIVSRLYPNRQLHALFFLHPGYEPHLLEIILNYRIRAIEDRGRTTLRLSPRYKKPGL